MKEMFYRFAKLTHRKNTLYVHSRNTVKFGNMGHIYGIQYQKTLYLQLNAICRLQSCMNQTGKVKIMNSFLHSNFNYDSLLWNFRKTK